MGLLELCSTLGATSVHVPGALLPAPQLSLALKDGFKAAMFPSDPPLPLTRLLPAAAPPESCPPARLLPISISWVTPDNWSFVSRYTVQQFSAIYPAIYPFSRSEDRASQWHDFTKHFFMFHVQSFSPSLLDSNSLFIFLLSI